MTKYLVEGETLTDIADAIREQTGEAGQIQLKEFANKVASISGGKHTYSTTEQEVGEWIDGSTVYEITVDLQNQTIIKDTDTTVTLPSSLNIETIIYVEAFITLSSGADIRTLPFGVGGTYFTTVNAQNGNLIFRRGGNNITFEHIYATIRYTKAAAANLTRSQEPEEEKEETTSTEEKEGGEEK